jgi:hypothetical protein
MESLKLKAAYNYHVLQVESCFLNHNSSIHFCCADSLLMTHRGGLSLSIIIWRIGGGGPSCVLPWGPNMESLKLKAAYNYHVFL